MYICELDNNDKIYRGLYMALIMEEWPLQLGAVEMGLEMGFTISHKPPFSEYLTELPSRKCGIE